MVLRSGEASRKASARSSFEGVFKAKRQVLGHAVSYYEGAPLLGRRGAWTDGPLAVNGEANGWHGIPLEKSQQRRRLSSFQGEQRLGTKCSKPKVATR